MTSRDYIAFVAGMVSAVLILIIFGLRIYTESQKYGPLDWVELHKKEIGEILNKYNCELTTNTGVPGTLWLINKSPEKSVPDDIYKEIGAYLVKNCCPYGVSRVFKDYGNR